MRTCRRCHWAAKRAGIGFLEILTAVMAGWKGKHFHKVGGKFIFLKG